MRSRRRDVQCWVLLSFPTRRPFFAATSHVLLFFQIITLSNLSFFIFHKLIQVVIPSLGWSSCFSFSSCRYDKSLGHFSFFGVSTQFGILYGSMFSSASLAFHFFCTLSTLLTPVFGLMCFSVSFSNEILLSWSYPTSVLSYFTDSFVASLIFVILSAFSSSAFFVFVPVCSLCLNGETIHHYRCDNSVKESRFLSTCLISDSENLLFLRVNSKPLRFCTFFEVSQHPVELFQRVRRHKHVNSKSRVGNGICFLVSHFDARMSLSNC